MHFIVNMTKEITVSLSKHIVKILGENLGKKIAIDCIHNNYRNRDAGVVIIAVESDMLVVLDMFGGSDKI